MTTTTTKNKTLVYSLIAIAMSAAIPSFVVAVQSMEINDLQEQIQSQQDAYEELETKAKSAWNAQYALEDAFCKARGHGDGLWFAYSDGYRHENSTLITAEINCVMLNGMRYEYIHTFDPAQIQGVMEAEDEQMTEDLEDQEEIEISPA